MYLNILPIKNVSRFNTLHYPNHFSMHAVHLLHVDDPPLLLLDSRFIKTFMVVLVMIPISMLRNISKLEKVHVHKSKFCQLLLHCMTCYWGPSYYGRNVYHKFQLSCRETVHQFYVTINAFPTEEQRKRSTHNTFPTHPGHQPFSEQGYWTRFMNVP